MREENWNSYSQIYIHSFLHLLNCSFYNFFSNFISLLIFLFDVICDLPFGGSYLIFLSMMAVSQNLNSLGKLFSYKYSVYKYPRNMNLIRTNFSIMNDLLYFSYGNLTSHSHILIKIIGSSFEPKIALCICFMCLDYSIIPSDCFL
jgi:hypothetical protein